MKPAITNPRILPKPMEKFEKKAIPLVWSLVLKIFWTIIMEVI